WEGLPGVTRSYTGLAAAAEEGGMARVWEGVHWSFDSTAGLALGRSVADYVFQNFLLPRTSPPSPAGPGSIRLHVTAGIVHGSSSFRPDTTNPGLLPEHRVPLDATNNAVVSNTPAVEASRSVRQQAQSRTHVRNVDDVFGSADPWEERLASAP